MGKRKLISADQLGFTFEPPKPASMPAALAGLEQRISVAVATMLHDAAAEGISRQIMAARVSELLGDDEVSKSMLDAYASGARDGHKVPMSRFLALIAVTDRHDLLNHLVRPIGAAVLVGEEIHTARIGHIDRQIARLNAERKAIAGRAPEIRGNRGT